MILINTWEEINKLSKELIELKSEKIIDRFLFGGIFHQGHINFIKEIRKECDILIVQFNEIYHYLNFYLRNSDGRCGYIPMPEEYFQKIIMSVYPSNKYIDYLVINKLPPKDKLEKIISGIIKYFPPIKEEITKLNLPLTMAIECMWSNVSDPIQKAINVDKMSPKNLIQRSLHKKLFSSEYKDKKIHSEHDYNKYTHFKIFKDNNGNVYSRGKGALSFLRPLAMELINKGIKDFTSFENVIMTKIIMDARCSIIDYTSLERIYELTDNCALIYSDIFSYEIIFFKDGEII